MKKLFATLLAAVLLVAAGAGAYHGFKAKRFNSDAPIGDFRSPRDKREARQQDLTQLALFFDLERSWTEDTLGKAKALFADLETRAHALSDAQFELEVARIAACADNAHTKIREYNRTPRYNRLPIRTHLFSDGLYIIRAYQGFEHLLGKQITAVENRETDRVISRLRPFVGGPDGSFRKYLPYLLESPQLMFAAGLTRDPSQMALTLRDTDGSINTETFAGPFPSSSQQIARSHLLLSPEIYAKSQPDWRGLLPLDEKTPLYLQTPLKKLQMKRIPEIDATYVQFRTNNDTNDLSISSFCKGAIKAYKKHNTRLLILDHRFNSGGNFHKTRRYMKTFAELVPESGRMYIVVGGATFSAGIYSAAFAKAAAGARATLIGEPVGDRLRMWAEDNLLRLPNSEIEIKFSTGLHDLKNGCNDWSKCYWGSINLDLRVETLAPEIPAALSFQHYLERRDPVLEAIKGEENLF